MIPLGKISVEILSNNIKCPSDRKEILRGLFELFGEKAKS